MNVRLIAITKPEIDGIETADQLIAYTARVSNPSNQLNTETSDRLIAYCIKNRHWSIFEQADLTVEIKTSRAIAAQILRHKSFSFQEYSQRYAQVNALEELQWRLQGKTNRQVGEGEVKLDEATKAAVNAAQNAAQEAYDKLLSVGIAKECARMVLPLNTQTTLYMKGSVRSWIHYLEVRHDGHAQKEHRDIAGAIWVIFQQQFPTVSKALGWQ
jgi:thymidylate synthase (FAD)